MNIMDDNSKKLLVLKSLAAFLILGVTFATGFWVGSRWPWVKEPQPVTIMAQEQAETAAGVQQAAQNAGARLNGDEEAAEIAAQIAAAPKRPPERVVETTESQVPQTAQRELQRAGADFAIITQPGQVGTIPAAGDDAAGTVSLRDSELVRDKKKPALDRPVQLAQYNITTDRRREVYWGLGEHKGDWYVPAGVRIYCTKDDAVDLEVHVNLKNIKDRPINGGELHFVHRFQ